VERLPERVLARKLFELRDKGGVTPQREVDLDPALECGNAKLFETRDRRLQPLLVGEVVERRAAPKSEGTMKDRRRGGRLGDLRLA
jgi:hypothetical protein